MPMKRSDYPRNWESIVAAVRERCSRDFRTTPRCECRGECGKSHLLTFDDDPERCQSRHGDPIGAGRKIVLTTAHLNAKDGPCQCRPLCGYMDHLRAMCQGCHLRYDHPRHIAKGRANRRAKLAVGDLFDRVKL